MLAAYRPLLPRDRFPLVVLAITMAAADVDANVHPTKAWVRFRQPRVVQEMVVAALHEALRRPGVVPAFGGEPAAWPVAGEVSAAGVAPVEQAALFQEAAAPYAARRFGRVLGQVQDTFIVSTTDDEVFFLDQHVVHERVSSSRCGPSSTLAPWPRRRCCFRRRSSWAPASRALLERWREPLERLGFAFEGFGGDAVVLRAVPTLLKGDEPTRLLEGAVEELADPKVCDADAGSRRWPSWPAGPPSRPARRWRRKRWTGWSPTSRPPRRPTSAPTAGPSSAGCRCTTSGASSSAPGERGRTLQAMTRGKPPLLVIAGPTGVGKTAAVVALARRLPIEVISADSRQVYRGMDVATGKPTLEEQRAVAHHLVDVVDPDDRYHAARFRVDAAAAIDAVRDRGRLPVVVGGTGLYIRALLRGLDPAPPADLDFRARAGRRRRPRRAGGAARAAGRRRARAGRAGCTRNDEVRVVRALERLRAGSAVGRGAGAVAPGRAALARDVRADWRSTGAALMAALAARAAAMVEAGLLDEVRGLLGRGYGPALPALQGIGYRQFVEVALGRLDGRRRCEQMQRETVRYAKRQVTWFAREPDVEWIDVGAAGGAEAVAATIEARISREGCRE